MFLSDDESGTATEDEDEVRARELRKQEVWLEIPPGGSDTDTGSDTEVKRLKLSQILLDNLPEEQICSNDDTPVNSSLKANDDPTTNIDSSQSLDNSEFYGGTNESSELDLLKVNVDLLSIENPISSDSIASATSTKSNACPTAADTLLDIVENPEANIATMETSAEKDLVVGMNELVIDNSIAISSNEDGSNGRSTDLRQSESRRTDSDQCNDEIATAAPAKLNGNIELLQKIVENGPPSSTNNIPAMLIADTEAADDKIGIGVEKQKLPDAIPDAVGKLGPYEGAMDVESNGKKVDDNLPDLITSSPKWDRQMSLVSSDKTMETGGSELSLADSEDIHPTKVIPEIIEIGESLQILKPQEETDGEMNTEAEVEKVIGKNDSLLKISLNNSSDCERPILMVTAPTPTMESPQLKVEELEISKLAVPEEVIPKIDDTPNETALLPKFKKPKKIARDTMELRPLSKECAQMKMNKYFETTSKKTVPQKNDTLLKEIQPTEVKIIELKVTPRLSDKVGSKDLSKYFTKSPSQDGEFGARHETRLATNPPKKSDPLSGRLDIFRESDSKIIDKQFSEIEQESSELAVRNAGAFKPLDGVKSETVNSHVLKKDEHIIRSKDPAANFENHKSASKQSVIRKNGKEVKTEKKITEMKHPAGSKSDPSSKTVKNVSRNEADELISRTNDAGGQKSKGTSSRIEKEEVEKVTVVEKSVAAPSALQMIKPVTPVANLPQQLLQAPKRPERRRPSQDSHSSVEMNVNEVKKVTVQPEVPVRKKGNPKKSIPVTVDSSVDCKTDKKSASKGSGSCLKSDNEEKTSNLGTRLLGSKPDLRGSTRSINTSNSDINKKDKCVIS